MTALSPFQWILIGIVAYLGVAWIAYVMLIRAGRRG